MTLYIYKPRSCVSLMYVIIFMSEELWGQEISFNSYFLQLGVIH